MLKIRPYRDSDRQDVEYICIATAARSQVETENLMEQTLLLYNRYYTRAEPEHCFVAVDEQDKAVGYVLCATDYRRYKQQFMIREIKALRKLGPAGVVLAYGEVVAPKPFAKKFPAHLHINILPEFQHQGIGTKLIDCLKEHLHAIGVPGVVLVAGQENWRAIAFYQKYGFERLGNLGGGVAYGLLL